MEKEQLLLYEHELGNLGIIKPPLINKIIKTGQVKFNKILSVFLVDFESFQVPEEYKKQIKLLDLFFCGNEEIPNMLMEALKFIYDTDDVILTNEGILINDTVLINRDNFDLLISYVKEVFLIEKKNEEKESNIQVKNPENNPLLEELKKARRQNKEDNKTDEISLKQIINVVIHNKYTNFTYKDVLDMTYYQLINSYKCVMQEDNYYTFMDYKTSGQFDIKQDIQHWSELIR